jgi:hypothetical protein
MARIDGAPGGKPSQSRAPPVRPLDSDASEPLTVQNTTQHTWQNNRNTFLKHVEKCLAIRTCAPVNRVLQFILRAALVLIVLTTSVSAHSSHGNAHSDSLQHVTCHDLNPTLTCKRAPAATLVLKCAIDLHAHLGTAKTATRSEAQAARHASLLPVVHSAAPEMAVAKTAGTVVARLHHPQPAAAAVLTSTYHHRQLTGLGSTEGALVSSVYLKGIAMRRAETDPGLTRAELAALLAKHLPGQVRVDTFPTEYRFKLGNETMVYPYWKVVLSVDTKDNTLLLMDCVVKLLTLKVPLPVWHQPHAEARMHIAQGLPHVMLQPTNIHHTIRAEHQVTASVTITGDEHPKLPVAARLSAILQAYATEKVADLLAAKATPEAIMQNLELRLCEAESVVGVGPHQKAQLTMHLPAGAATALAAGGQASITTSKGNAILTMHE